MHDSQKEDRYDLWLGRLVRAFASIIGFLVFIYEVLRGKSLEFGLMALGMAGVGFGRAIERFLEWLTTFRPPGREGDK